MESYCEVYLSGYQIDTSKSYVNPFYCIIFNEADKRVRIVSYEDYYTEPFDETGLVPAYEYAATVAVIKQRLELLGYSLEESKKIFAEGLKKEIAYFEELFRENNDGFEAHHITHLSALLEKGFDYWLIVLRGIIQGNLHDWDLDNLCDRDKDDLKNFILDLNGEDFWLGYPDLTIGNFLRAALEAVDEQDELILDITSLISAGYYQPDELICQTTAYAHISSTIAFQKIIILTEGKSDSEFLSRTLNLLYPAITDYFSFLEFDAAKADGGSAALERNVKAFAAAGVSNKIIALFDNDAAGLASLDRLNKIELPFNVKVLALPDFDLAKSYPTIGPQGTTLENVNGRACSIEMYFGEDVLRTSSGYSPVHWKGLEDRIRQYQGELIEKPELQRRFLAKLSSAEKNGINSSQDWSGLSLILKAIFSAVSYQQPAMIILE